MPGLSDNACKILESRYLLRNEHHELVETPVDMLHRVAPAVAEAEVLYSTQARVKDWAERFFSIMNGLLFLPNSPTLMNAGRLNGQLSACFVLPVEDNLNHIFSTLKSAALIQQSGGGTGFNFSQLRPSGSFIKSTDGEASGPVSFMKMYDCATEYIKQGGKRRGANMGILNINHPDIEEFITSKSADRTLRNFNISLGITDLFMQAFENNENWTLGHPKANDKKPKIKARELWKLLVKNAWHHGDPGLVFLDAINKFNPTPTIGKITATNPCGEMPLLPFESCNLGSLNLSLMVKPEGTKYQVDWNLLKEVIPVAVRFLDNVIDVNHYILPEIKKVTLGNRKIGLGVMGWAEMLIKLNLPYASRQAVDLAEKLMQFINNKCMAASQALAQERGAFGNWDRSIYYPKIKLRNATRTSIAPTGSISIIANTSSSIEPLFALAYRRSHVLSEETLVEINKLFLNHLKTHGNNDRSIIEAIKAIGIIGPGQKIPAKTQALFKTSLQIAYDYHLKHQLAFQKHTDNAVSKTINLPEHSTLEDVSKIFLTAWKSGAKGITIYRYNSKQDQVLKSGITTDDEGKMLKVNQNLCKVCLD